MDTNQNKYSVAAIIGMILGILALLAAAVMAGYYFGIPGLIVSIIAMVNIKKKELCGKGMAIAGIITSALALIISIVITVATVLWVGAATDAVEDTVDKYEDVNIAQTIDTAITVAYFNPDVYEDMQYCSGSTIVLTEDIYAALPESFRSELEATMGISGVPVPTYTENGAQYFAVAFTEDGCETIYTTDGVSFWEIYPNTCDEYYY